MKYKSIVITVAVAFLVVVIQSCKMDKLNNEATLFVGTYTNNGSEGIYSYSFDQETGLLNNQNLAASLRNPSFINLSPDRNMLYAVSEVDDYKENSGSISTFRVSGSVLEKLDTKPTYGANPCYVGISNNGKYVTVANYTGGNVAIFDRKNNGELGSVSQVIDHKVLDTGKTAHAHMSKFINGELFVSDLGLDRIKKYSLINGAFVPSQQAELVVAEGSGPRHFTNSKDGKFLYAINELNSTISVFEKDGEKYNSIETYDTLASNFDGESFCADLHLSPDGKFLYGSNRGENTIVIFKVNASNGKLQLIGRESVKGDWPRNFTMDQSGGFLLVANERSNNIVIFKRDIQKGTLSFINEVALPSPVCLEFY